MTEGTSRLAEAASLLAAGRFQEAKTLAATVLRAHPDDLDAKHLLGVIAWHEGAYDDSERLLVEVLARRPDLAVAHYNHGNALLKLRRFEEALAAFDRALARRPGFVEALVNRGVALHSLGRDEEALVVHDQALVLRPSSFDAQFGRGNALLALRRLRDAEQAFAQALTLQPNSAHALNNYGAVLARRQHQHKALTYFARALERQPDFRGALANRARARLHVGEFLGAREDYLHLRAADPGNDDLRLNLILTELPLAVWDHYKAALSHVDDLIHAEAICTPFSALSLLTTAASQLKNVERYVAGEIPQQRRQIPPYAHDKLRIAYLSTDFHNHATSYLIAGLFEAHDRDKFEITAVSFTTHVVDEMRRRVQAGVDHFVAMGDLDDWEVADRLRAMEIDIVVDLNGHTRGNRLAALASGAAPLQVAYLGFPGSSGAPFIDYIIADRHVIPDSDRGFYTEQVVALPDSYQVNDDKRAIAPQTPSRAAVGLPPTGVVFCCFNQTNKVLPGIFEVWMRVLKAVPDSVLWLLESSVTASDNLRREAQAQGVAPERLAFAPQRPLAEHLARVGLADLFLDTLPVNAHTTASDALWAGIPVLTCTGSAFSGRVATSLLHAVGLPELITTSLRDYEDLARALGQNPERLAALKQKTHDLRRNAPLFDTARFARHIEAAYTMMQQRLLRGEAPASFAVPPL